MRTALQKTVLLALLFAAFSLPVRAAEWKDGFLTMPDGAKIHYLEAGQGPAIVLVPGWSMAAEIWEPQITGLSKSHRVVAYDPRSQGQSTKMPDGSFPEVRARDLGAVLDQLGLAPATLVCWSLAVNECVTYISQSGTGKIAGLVLVDGLAGDLIDPDTLPALIRYLGRLQRDRQKMTEAFVRSMFKKPQTEEYLKRITEASLKTPTDTGIALFVGSLTQNTTETLAKIDKPTLLAVTQNPFTMERYKQMNEKVPGSKLEVFQAGHALFVDEPERFNKLLEDFVKSLAPDAVKGVAPQ
jgi:non-heme chloroperoxidase